MTSPATRQKDTIALGEFIETLNGKLVRVSQAISWRPGTDFERHSTVHVRFSFRVKSTTWAMSGGHFMLYGEDDSLYSVGTTKLQHLELTDSRATITELYDSGAERQSIIEVVDTNA